MVCQKPELRGKGSGSGSDNEPACIVCDSFHFFVKTKVGILFGLELIGKIREG